MDSGQENTAKRPVVCVLQVRGEANEQFDREGLETALKDAEAYAPDLIVVDVDTTWKLYRGNDKSVYSVADVRASLDEVDAATDTASMLSRYVTDAGQRAKPVRVVTWLGQAVGPSAVLGFCCPETYYRSAAVHGGIASARQIDTPELERARRSGGYERATLRWGRIEAVAMRAGYHPEVVQAMYSDDRVLSYSVEAHGIRFFENDLGNTLLTDGGGDPDRDQARDTLDESLAFTGNDMLVLRGEQGVKLGVAKACVDALDELVGKMGLVGPPTVITLAVRKLGPAEHPQK